MKKYIGLVVLIILGGIFIKYGRSIYIPVVNKFKGAETVESRILKIENGVRARIEENLNNAGFAGQFPKQIILAAFKEEQKLQLYSNDNGKTQLIKEYPFTAYSGKLGPKLKEGDKQIPEGIYEVEYLNPNSSYYLSIKVNYPNQFDKSKTTYTNHADMGGDIFIHGKSATIGCIPIGDSGIEEVFLLTKKAINKKVKVIISPRDFRSNPIYPEIDKIEWEDELYDLISKELKTLHNTLR